MKTWTTPKVEILDVKETAGNNHQTGNSHGKTCRYNEYLPCNAQGNGKGICNDCMYNPNYSNTDRLS